LSLHGQDSAIPVLLRHVQRLSHVGKVGGDMPVLFWLHRVGLRHLVSFLEANMCVLQLVAGWLCVRFENAFSGGSIARVPTAPRPRNAKEKPWNRLVVTQPVGLSRRDREQDSLRMAVSKFAKLGRRMWKQSGIQFPKDLDAIELALDTLETLQDVISL
jgi:hypothetical protein